MKMTILYLKLRLCHRAVRRCHGVGGGALANFGRRRGGGQFWWRAARRLSKKNRRPRGLGGQKNFFKDSRETISFNPQICRYYIFNLPSPVISRALHRGFC